MSIVVQNITKLYGDQKALNDVSFEIKSGEVVGFLGPNGAGKSTMMKILTGYLPQSMGVASVAGFNVLEQSLEVRQQVGYLPENNPLYTDMYVREYLEFAAGVYKLAKAGTRISEMINRVGLDLEKHKKIGALSKGYRQRVGLAQALLHDPAVLILDEPTTGLDPNQISEIRNLIKEVGREKTVLLSSHILSEVQAICHRVIIIDRGIIKADDETGNVVRQGSKEKVLSVEFSEKVSRDQLQSIVGVIDAKHGRNNTWAIVFNEELDIRKEVFDFAVRENLAVLGMQVEEKTLEEVFKELTRSN